MAQKHRRKYARKILPRCFRCLFTFFTILASSVFIHSKILRGGDRFFADFSLVEGGKRLTRNCVGNYTDVDLQKCIHKCMSNESCLTFNYHKGFKVCELLNISKFDQLGLLEYHIGWNHYETDCNQKKIGEICEASNLCLEFETCEVTFDSRRYICRCPDGFNGTKCGQYIGRGSSSENPAPACFLILRKYNVLTDGYYWLKKEDNSTAAKKYCRRDEDSTKWSPWSPSCSYPDEYQSRRRECKDPREMNQQMRNCEDEIEKRRCFTLPASCNEIIKHNNASKNGMYKINKRQPIMVYCDMESGSGGWMLVVNVTVDKEISEAEAIQMSSVTSTNIEELYKAERENILFDIRYLKNIATTFQQLRFYCHKNGRTIHIYTKTNSRGKAVTNYFLNGMQTKPKACFSYGRYANDNSTLTRECHNWVNRQWGNKGRVVLKFPFYISGVHHFGVSGDRFECDDSVDVTSNKGIWKIYVR